MYLQQTEVNPYNSAEEQFTSGVEVRCGMKGGKSGDTVLSLRWDQCGDTRAALMSSLHLSDQGWGGGKKGGRKTIKSKPELEPLN